ncbi:MAG: hypothetical protein MR008_01370 [Aerococcus sp.]|nr:hypothetical protein [Aerococcus sp.]
MRYRSSQDVHTIYQKANKRLKKQRLAFCVMLLWQTLLLVAMIGIPLGLLWYWHLLPPRVALVPLVLGATTQLPIYLMDWFNVFAPWQIGVLGIVWLVLTLLFVFGRTLTGYGYWLKLMDQKADERVEPLDVLKHRPIRHFLVGWTKNLAAVVALIVWSVACLFIGVYSYAWLLTILRTGMNTVMRVAFLSGVAIIFIGSLVLIAWGLLWLYLGMKWVTLPLSDAPEMVVHRAYAISWQLMKNNRRLFVKLKLRHYLPPLVVGIALSLIAMLVDWRRVPYAPLVMGIIGVLFILWTWYTWGKSQLTEVLLYREQTEQYARRLNDRYPDFHARPKPGLAQRYRTDKHPTFSPKAVRVSLPADSPAATDSTPTYRPKHRYQMTSEDTMTDTAASDEIPDPGYRLNKDQLEKPIAARDIFDEHAHNKKHQ